VSVAKTVRDRFRIPEEALGALATVFRVVQLRSGVVEALVGDAVVASECAEVGDQIHQAAYHARALRRLARLGSSGPRRGGRRRQ
jgi:hypothetical protein